ncbi:fumarylacetoacetate hydrolase family protein [Methyloraptor flagellatus]|uniref:Fumarylacetoacetate hydrolase family protein n=1 Tax=Methyloraptor flagellatus TaxID=3162530 RepID=A0AAU7XA66_9HYPH
MTAFVIPAPAQPAVPVAGGGRFPVRRIFCVGRNYADHAREMGGDPDREPPFFFTKPADAIVTSGAATPYPTETAELHFEIELVVAIGTAGRDIAVGDALAHVYGYAVGIDLTRRDLQAAAKKGGRPWDMAKGFDASAPIGFIQPASVIGHPAKGGITLSVDGVIKQSSDLAKMIWSVPETIACLSRLVALEPGDLIFTGTPDGVGPTVRGEALHGSVEGVGEILTRIV